MRRELPPPCGAHPPPCSPWSIHPRTGYKSLEYLSGYSRCPITPAKKRECASLPFLPPLDRATGHVWGSVYSVERLVCVTSWAPLPRDLAFLPCLFRYKCETSFVRTSAASQGIYYGMRPRFEDASNGSMPIGVGCLRKVLALEVEVV